MDYSMSVQLGDYFVPVIIEYKNNKNMYIRVTDHLELYVTVHKSVKIDEIKKVIDRSKNSLIKMYEKKQKELDKNIYFYYLGKPYTIIYDVNTKYPSILDDCIVVKDKKMLDKFYKDECLRVFKIEIDKYIDKFSYLPKFSLRIRLMKTRWGVCNRGNNTVTLNTELLKKDISLIDYVIVHELSHFKEANHSSAFWREVSLRYPNYKEARKLLNSV